MVAPEYDRTVEACYLAAEYLAQYSVPEAAWALTWVGRVGGCQGQEENQAVIRAALELWKMGKRLQESVE